MHTESAIQFANSRADLQPSPVNPAWIREGKPVARNAVLSVSADGRATTLIWDCTAGRFDWHYDIDETVYVIEGAVRIKDPNGSVRQVGAGDTIYFPAGTSAEWTVGTYVRKVAFCRKPMTRRMVFMRRVYRGMKWAVGMHKRGGAAPAMFGDPTA